MEKGKKLTKLLDLIFVPSSFFRTIKKLEEERRLQDLIKNSSQAYYSAIVGESIRVIAYYAGIKSIIELFKKYSG